MDNLEQINSELNLIWEEKYKIYENLDNDIIKRGLKICGIKNASKDTKLAIAKRLIDLKIEPLENELKNLNIPKESIDDIKKQMYDLTVEFNMHWHEKLLKQIKSLLSPFYYTLISGVHHVGLHINEWQKAWQSHIIDNINKKLSKKFNSLSETNDFLNLNNLYMKDSKGNKADRIYGALLEENDSFSIATYATVFKKEIEKIVQELSNLISNLKDTTINNNNELSYIDYFCALKEAFECKEISKCIQMWQEAERKWMSVKSQVQVAHPLEYYEDIYTHAVAPEWDIRLCGTSGINEKEFKAQFLNSFDQISKKITNVSKSLIQTVIQNINNTQMYIGSPMFFYGAELDGLFSAQVVPNDESVSAEHGKKIFAFTNHIRTAAMARPFMQLSAEIFSKDFLDFGRKILFCQPKTWTEVYNITTIGHEFGHILFIESDTESKMNKSGVFKFIEEYKATSGGLINFFLHENSYEKHLQMAVFHDLITRSVGLIAWKEVSDVRAYYCEGLIHLDLLFKSGVLKFKNKILDIDFTQSSYENYKNLSIQTYIKLADHYTQKLDAQEFLSNFCISEDDTYMPLDKNVFEFVKYYYDRYKEIGNKTDKSEEYARYKAIAIK